MRLMRHLMLCVFGVWVGAGCALAADVALPAPSATLGGLTAAPITVIEPIGSTPLKPVEVTYKGYPVVPLLDQWLGDRWRAAGVLVAFETRDGYLSMIPSERLLHYPAYLVYANARGADFSVETPPLNHRIALGPWYLVWDNILNPSLRVDGATYWPYQVTQVSLIDQSRLNRLMPPMLPERYHGGAELTLKYCLACHQVNGVGGTKAGVDLGRTAAGQSFAQLATWVLDPASKNPLTTMPALAPERPASERQLLARQIYGYLRAMGALAK